MNCLCPQQSDAQKRHRCYRLPFIPSRSFIHTLTKPSFPWLMRCDDSPWQCGCAILVVLCSLVSWEEKSSDSDSGPLHKSQEVPHRSSNLSKCDITSLYTGIKSLQHGDIALFNALTELPSQSLRNFPAQREMPWQVQNVISYSVPSSSPRPLPLGHIRGVSVAKRCQQRYFPCLRGGCEQLFQLFWSGCEDEVVPDELWHRSESLLCPSAAPCSTKMIGLLYKQYCSPETAWL